MEKFNSEDKIIIIFGVIVIMILGVFFSLYINDIIKPLDKYVSFYYSNESKILIISPHPDDEVAMAGSIMLQHDPN